MGMLSPVYADATIDQQLKLSFIYNFAKFVTFPNTNNITTPFVICVIGVEH